MKNFFCIVLALSLVSVCSQANASILGSLLSFDGNVDTLVDQGFANVYDGATGNLTSDFSVGNVIAGFVTIDQAGDPPSDISPSSVVFAFVAEIAGVNGLSPLGTPVLDLQASTVAGLQLTDFLAGTEAADGSGNEADEAGTVFAVFEGISPPAVDPSSVSSVADFTAANGYSYTGSGGIVSSDDFFEFTPLPVPFGGNIGFQAGGFSIIDNPLGGGTVYLPVGTQSQVVGSGTTFHDVIITQSNITDDSGNANFALGGNTNFQLNAVPEPSSLISFAGLVLPLSLVRRRKS